MVAPSSLSSRPKVEVTAVMWSAPSTENMLVSVAHSLASTGAPITGMCWDIRYGAAANVTADSARITFT